MSKSRERLSFNWQKNNNNFIFSVSLLLAIFSIKSLLPQKYILWIYLLMAILIWVCGNGLIQLTISEKEYSDSLRDGREKIRLLDKISSWALIFISIIIGIMIVVIGINIWKEIFLANFGG